MQESNPQTALTLVQRGLKAKFPTIIDLLAILGAFTLAQLLGLAVAMLCGYSVDYSLLASPDEHLVRSAQIAIGKFIFVSYLVTLSATIIFTLIYRRLRGVRGVPIARLSLRGLNPTLLLWGIILLCAIAIALDPLLSYLPEAPKLEGRGLMMILSLIVVAPILEELLCRGIILESLREKWGVLVACLISSLFFGVMHLHPTLVINAFVIGLLLSYLYVRTRSLIAPIVLHGFNNALAFMLIYFGYEGVTLMEIIPDRTIYNLIYYPSLAILILSILVIARTLARMDRQERINAEQ